MTTNTEYLIPVGEDDIKRMDSMSQIYNKISMDWLEMIYWNKRGLTFLDIGCGNGCFTIPFARKHPEINIVAIDISEEQLNLAKEASDGLSNITFHKIDIQNLKIMFDTYGQFNIVHCRFVLTHQPNPIEIAENLLKLTKTGGCLIMQESNGFNFECYNGESRAISAWKHVVKLQHMLQCSSLDTAKILRNHFTSNTVCGLPVSTEWFEAIGKIDTVGKKNLFVEGVKQALKRIEEFKNSGKPLSPDLNPIDKFGYTDGTEWLEEMKTIQNDPAQVFSLGVACIAVFSL